MALAPADGLSQGRPILTRREQIAAATGRRQFMGLLDGVLGGIIGAGTANLVAGLIDRHGGVSGLVTQFEQNGLGGIVQSWVGTGANLPVTPEQIQKVLGSQTVADLAGKFGLNPQDFAAKVAQLLPEAVDKMTPGGVVPHN
jgi:uncharacterized protein YidB (DUF937 family)